MGRIDMHTLQEFVRLARMGTGYRAIARMLRISPNTEREYRKALEAAGLLAGEPGELVEPDVLQAALAQHKPPRPPPQQVSTVERWHGRGREGKRAHDEVCGQGPERGGEDGSKAQAGEHVADGARGQGNNRTCPRGGGAGGARAPWRIRAMASASETTSRTRMRPPHLGVGVHQQRRVDADRPQQGHRRYAAPLRRQHAGAERLDGDGDGPGHRPSIAKSGDPHEPVDHPSASARRPPPVRGSPRSPTN